MSLNNLKNIVGDVDGRCYRLVGSWYDDTCNRKKKYCLYQVTHGNSINAESIQIKNNLKNKSVGSYLESF